MEMVVGNSSGHPPELELQLASADFAHKRSPFTLNLRQDLPWSTDWPEFSM